MVLLSVKLERLCIQKAFSLLYFLFFSLAVLVKDLAFHTKSLALLIFFAY